MSKGTFFAVALLMGCLVNIAVADDITLTNATAVVVKTIPEAGSSGVDVSLKEINVTFSKEMRDGSWSWSTLGPESAPDFKGKPHYLSDKKTCVISVDLKPGKTYAIWVNSPKFGNFKDASGKSSVPYLLVFETKK